MGRDELREEIAMFLYADFRSNPCLVESRRIAWIENRIENITKETYLEEASDIVDCLISKGYLDNKSKRFVLEKSPVGVTVLSQDWLEYPPSEFKPITHITFITPNRDTKEFSDFINSLKDGERIEIRRNQ
jgi:hypothetical protein